MKDALALGGEEGRDKLRKSGVKLPNGIITDEELAQALCQ